MEHTDRHVDMGFAVPVSGSWARPDNQVEVARTAERLGYTTMWTFQRLVFPSGADAKWAQTYRSVLDPLVSLGYLAGATERIRLGVAVVNAPFFSPALLAKQLTTIDVLSGGRLVAGVGLGWSDEEYEASGLTKERRGRRLEEHVEVMKRLWTLDDASFTGDFYSLPRIRQDPKPVQRPHPPVLLGGTAEPALRRAGRIADGWVSASAFSPEQMAKAITTVRESAADAGRDPARLSFVCRGAVRIRPEPEPDAAYSGTVEQVRRRIAEVAEAGITEFFVDLNFDPTIGSPTADAGESMRRAREALEAFAPAP